MSQRSNNKIASNTSSGVFGAGGGTVFLQLAQSIKDPALRQVAIYLAPTVAVGTTAVSIWIRTWLQEYQNKKLQQRSFDNAVHVLLEIMNNPYASQEAKEEAKRDLDMVQRARKQVALEPIINMTKAAAAFEKALSPPVKTK